jgi:hypothetical protein
MRSTEDLGGGYQAVVIGDQDCAGVVFSHGSGASKGETDICEHFSEIFDNLPGCATNDHLGFGRG